MEYLIDTKESIADIVWEEVKKAGIPRKVDVSVRPFSEVYPNSDEVKDSYSIGISIESEEKNPIDDFECSYFDFLYNREKKVIERVCTYLEPELRQGGYRKKLVKVMEETGTRLGCSKAIVNIVTNHKSWKRLGYLREENRREKKLV